MLRDRQKSVTIETQTDWDWAMNAGTNQSQNENKREEVEGEEEEAFESCEEEEEEEEDEQSLFDSTKSLDLVSCDNRLPFQKVDHIHSFSLANVGPPRILQYCQESEKDRILQKEIEESIVPTRNVAGLCDFCQKLRKPLPTFEEESALMPEELYCCEEYQEFLEMVLQNEIAEARLRQKNEREKERENLKNEKNLMKEKKIEGKKEWKNKTKPHESRLKQKAETLPQQPQIPPQGYHSTRQLNTINYQLSSRRCLEEGWTVRTPYLEQQDFEGDVFEVEPGKRMTLWRGQRVFGGNEAICESPLEKFYDNGKKFFTIFADGTGNIFYPSGRLAVLITATQPCHFTYVIYHESNVRRRVAAIFEHTGYGTCYHANGNVRLYIDPSGGVEADQTGAIKRKWQWHQVEGRAGGMHIHAPPLQPIHIGLNPFIGIKLLSQRNIQLNFGAKKRFCKINMGVNVKPLSVIKDSSVPTKYTENNNNNNDFNQFYLQDKKTNIECLLSKVRNLLQYGHSPKLERILPPIYLTNKTLKLQQQAKQMTLVKKRPKVIVKTEISL